MKRERLEEDEGGPNKLQRQSGDLDDTTTNGSRQGSKPSSKVRKGTECPYLDTIARQVETLTLWAKFDSARDWWFAT